MPLPIPEPGLILRYAYLWHAESETDRKEATKDRPCVLVLAVTDRQGDVTVTVVPVTHTPPTNPDEAVEIPAPTKRRLGLDAERSWIVVTEVNRFVWPGPDLRPVSRDAPDRFDYGLLPPSLFNQVKARLLACAASRRLRAVRRTE